MKAITVKQPGETDQLQITEFNSPEPGDHDILVKVKATAVNRTDILNRKQTGGYDKTPVLGIEVAGVVEQAGEQSEVSKGERVMGLVNGGGYAEYAVMPASRAMPIPDHLSFTEAAAIPEVFLTAYQTLFWLGELDEKETVLVHAGGSGVGTAAIQLAKQLSRANVITTAGSSEKLDKTKELGADTCINYKQLDFAEEVKRFTNKQGADVILDFVGASYWEQNMDSIAVDGRWVLIGMLGGSKVKEANLGDLLAKRVHLKGTLLTPRSDHYKAELAHDFKNNALSLFETGQITPIIDQVFDFEDVKAAHDHMEHNKNIGKIVLRLERS